MSIHTFNQPPVHDDKTNSNIGLDFSHNTRVRVGVGVGTIALGFVTMAFPLIPREIFIQLFTIGLSSLAVVLMLLLFSSAPSLQQVVSGRGFKGYATLIVLLFAASSAINLSADHGLFTIAAMVIGYFLLDEVSTIVRTVRQQSFKCLVLPAIDLAVTLICLGMLISGLSVDGIFVVSAVLGLKVVLLGCSTVLTLSEPKNESFY
ncbi:hypothetical protein [Vibrio ezurae]|uniref:Uncharacterized protein n=1 Tax=Vibrio ezurae NBRC 102218 TaxID=1219080 RepID=U3CDP8_9VIBR|nr:hypothetical protein [Vibrio ezurae]GAD79384.1 hypothetical protein VEZ01S_11_00260 [Vibrio ezurae NBRC 102218]